MELHGENHVVVEPVLQWRRRNEATRVVVVVVVVVVRLKRHRFG